MNNTVLTTLLAGAGLLLSQAALANDEAAQTLAKDSGCLSCHAIDQKVVGPSYQSIAQKYAGQADALADLMASVQNGSKGKWGRIPMPAHRELSAQDLEKLVKWVLSQKG